MNYIDEGVVKHDRITNVSRQFNYLSFSYLTQGILSLICVTYQLVAIFFVNSLLAHRHYISRVNKLFLLYGAYILVMTHFYRLDEAGKVCSGDYLTQAEREDPAIAKNYLLEIGDLLYAYMIGIWGISVAAAVLSIIVLVQIYQTFS